LLGILNARMRRGWRHTLGLSVIALALLLALPVPAALGATGTWEFEPPVYDFGPVALGTHPVHQFSLTNTGETPIEGSSDSALWWYAVPGVEADLFHIVSNSCQTTLEPEESCSIGLSFNPNHPGYTEGELEVAARSGADNAHLAFEGHGVGAVAAIEPEHLEFGAVQAGSGASAPQSVVVKNNGNLGLTIGNMSFTDRSGAPEKQSPFQVVGGSCETGEPVAIWGGSCTIEVALAPSEAGSFSSRLVIFDNALSSPQSMELKGTGTPGPTAPPARSSILLTHHPAAITKRHRATFWFVTNPFDAGAECELDHHAFKPCVPPKRYTKLTKGPHSFSLRLSPVSSALVSANTTFHWQIRHHS
jgi:hypothetical protein